LQIQDPSLPDYAIGTPAEKIWKSAGGKLIEYE